MDGLTRRLIAVGLLGLAWLIILALIVTSPDAQNTKLTEEALALAASIVTGLLVWAQGRDRDAP